MKKQPKPQDEPPCPEPNCPYCALSHVVASHADVENAALQVTKRIRSLQAQGKAATVTELTQLVGVLGQLVAMTAVGHQVVPKVIVGMVQANGPAQA